MSTFYLTTPIYYPNARPHVGSAYTTIVCDVLARYKRMCGYDVAFLTGTDEHGEKLQRAADAAAIPVEKFVAEKRELFKELWRTLGISEYDPERPADYGYRFVHTSQNPAHVKAVHWMIRQADKAGYIRKKKYEGRYCVFDERYVSDGAEPANCDICGRPAELISEENYFFKLSEFEGRLLKLYDDCPKFVQPDFRMNEVKSFVKGGLRDISISRRRLKWGIPWPDDPEQVVYVWYDALTSYLTGLGFEGDKHSKDFEKYWMGQGREGGERQVVHMIGKDILRFHAVYWPAFLMAANLPLPTTVFAHGWIYYEQDKMSKSKGNVVYPEPIVEALNLLAGGSSSSAPSPADVGALLAAPTAEPHDARPGLDPPALASVSSPTTAMGTSPLQLRAMGTSPPRAQQAAPLRGPGNDALRYYLLREAPFGQDTSFSYEKLIERYNSDLANDLGNLASRTLTMIDRYFDGSVPGKSTQVGVWRTFSLRAVFNAAALNARRCFEAYDFSGGLDSVWRIVSQTNRYLVDAEPWAKAEDPTQRQSVADSLYVAAETLRFMAVLLQPALPASMQELWSKIGQSGRVQGQSVEDLTWGSLISGAKVARTEPIFPRLDKAKTLAKLHELAEADRSQAVSAQQSAVSSGQSSIINHPSSISKIAIDDFAKVEMLVGQILSAEAIPGAKKLLKLQVDIGTETRQVCAGIAEYYQPEQLVGMKIVLVANLEPRKLRGVESNGMVVAASIGPEAKPVLATFKEDVPNGTRLK